jgi:hypothetical protein
MKENKLTAVAAIWSAFINCDVSHYPRFLNAAGTPERMAEPAILAEIAGTLSDLKTINSAELNSFLERGRESLDEVKSLTEYQDQKATRVLTIVTFLSALSGALFARFADSYPLRALFAQQGIGIDSALVGLTYVLFALFVLSATCGALVIFHATRTRFKYPQIAPQHSSDNPSQTASYIFYSDILESRPAIWAKAFTKPAELPGTLELDPNLSLHYMKNYIGESYLVACKVADKLRYLQPAQDILSFSIRVLVLWLLVIGLTAMLVPSPQKTNGTPSQQSVYFDRYSH